ncbi:MAG: lysophospholipid acyltransferase family protein [Prochloraceae cyanobacterium]|nr:lysophospholipid acyltransferase family protein [Prochloraceae cyanobacterium]
MAHQDREPISSLILYRLFKWSVVNPMFRTYFRGKVYGAESVPQSGPFIAVSNHASYFDPPILSNSMGRPVAFMAKEELFRVPILKTGIRLYGAYPVNRASSDRTAIRSAIKALESGWMTGIFLQGTRTKNGRITNPKLGAALIAAKTQVPLIPVSLWGTEKILADSSFPRPVPVTIRIGDVIDPPQSTKKEELTAITEKCAEIINTMLDLGR